MIRAHQLRCLYGRSILFHRLYSSGSPSAATSASQEKFTKTGERVSSSDPMHISLRSEEYSQSGGDDMVAAQTDASYSRDANPASTKATAGKGNAVNPLEASPATPELSKRVDEIHVEKGVDRADGTKSGLGKTRKSKRVERTQLDFDTSKHKTNTR
ncbi:hypothetical protein DM02DRAFT_675456 [Periconia macrospinosa]|uniref:Uncharacterized protein n=1 Tax=Periconia macrospinosa TaxID=97972 RepID=A0A2V1DBM0_9PLEO|nr:hypothetical protein DM02DRAFT_675456 [Periconia macrospinosa]